ncbi:MAG: DNA protecting protein DprA [candidate division Zixibacteria bacterium 4484_95]|nr:MAG: DNA protecting protein DprA [candidate division Zixibacteria bacterium 4484_95]RKX20229.1 MAG: DNA-protecting protein DprA [candidate division Zixibacteria bacterium]
MEIDLVEVDTRFALMLSMVNGVGPIKYQQVINHFQDFDQFAGNDDTGIFENCGLNEKQVSSMLNFSRWNEIDEILQKAARFDVKVICLGQKNYPERLLNIYSPPLILYLKGALELLSKPSVAIVGSRTPTEYGRAMTRKIAGGLASRGLVIISGMAWGIDCEAHKAAIDNGGITAAVFGCGIDIIYPRGHRNLASKILEKGFLLSEFPFGTKPEKHNFPRRNRIISGLVEAVVVVEAAEKSGALVTAGLAVDQGKEVFAVPGRADNLKSHGTINLLKEGAAVATSPEDILGSLGWEISPVVGKSGISTEQIAIDLDPNEQKICDLVGAGPAHFDELVRKLGFQPSKISAIVLKLELAGLVVRRPGNYIARA